MVVIWHNAHHQGRNIDNARNPQVHIRRRITQHVAVREIAKSISERGLFTWRRDAPLDHALMRILARREAQQLNQMLGGIVVMIVGVVLNDEAHDVVFLVEFKLLKSLG